MVKSCINKPAEPDPIMQLDRCIGDLIDKLNQYSGELDRTKDKHRQIELINNIKDIHKHIKRVEKSLLKIISRNQ